MRLSNQQLSQDNISLEQAMQPSSMDQEVDEELIEKMENYLKEIIEENESSIDIGDTPIGNYGANCVAAVFNIADNLEDVRLVNCNINDEGAVSILSELQTNTTVRELDLSGNPLTEGIFDALVELCRHNQTL